MEARRFTIFCTAACHEKLSIPTSVGKLIRNSKQIGSLIYLHTNLGQFAVFVGGNKIDGYQCEGFGVEVFTDKHKLQQGQVLLCHPVDYRSWYVDGFGADMAMVHFEPNLPFPKERLFDPDFLDTRRQSFTFCVSGKGMEWDLEYADSEFVYNYLDEECVRAIIIDQDQRIWCDDCLIVHGEPEIDEISTFCFGTGFYIGNRLNLGDNITFTVENIIHGSF